jgi:hypothetical protein
VPANATAKWPGRDRPPRHSTGLLVVALLAGAALPRFGDASAYHGVVLGSKYFLAQYGHTGSGWGTPRPKTIDNGGDPSGIVEKIRWTTWGGKVAIGYGRNFITKPTGGYYATSVTIELKALNIGLCYKEGPRTYRKLVAREPSRPGGSMGAWFLWGGQKTLCKWQ